MRSEGFERRAFQLRMNLSSPCIAAVSEKATTSRGTNTSEVFRVKLELYRERRIGCRAGIRIFIHQDNSRHTDQLHARSSMSNMLKVRCTLEHVCVLYLAYSWIMDLSWYWKMMKVESGAKLRDQFSGLIRYQNARVLMRVTQHA